MKYQKIITTWCRDIGKKYQKYPQNVFFFICDPRIFFKIGLCHFLPLWCPNLMQNIRKNEWTVSEIFKDGPNEGQTGGATDKADYRINRVQNIFVLLLEVPLPFSSSTSGNYVPRSLNNRNFKQHWWKLLPFSDFAIESGDSPYVVQ